MDVMSSRERMLAIVRYQEPDHVGLTFNPFGFHPPAYLAWTNAYEEARSWLSIGADAWLDVSAPLEFAPEVKTRSWQETFPGERWPVMINEYDTPAGVLRQEIFRTDDWVTEVWPHGKNAGELEVLFVNHQDDSVTEVWPQSKSGDDSLHLLDDYNVPRYRRPLIRSEADLAKLEYLFHPLSDRSVAHFREGAEHVARQARELDVMLVGQGVDAGDTATWLCGAAGMLDMALDQPELFEALLDVAQARDRRSVELLLDTPVDLITIRGYYCGTTFWSPKLFRRFFAPRVKELVDLIHQGGRKAMYIMSVGVSPLLDDLAQIGYDAHYLLDPIESGGGRRVNLQKVKQAWNGKIAVIGGINDQITLEQGTREQIRQEVFETVSALGPGGGLALTPAEAIQPLTTWESIETLMEAWREVRDYPMGG